MINLLNVFLIAKQSWKKIIINEKKLCTELVGPFSAVNQGCRMVEVVEAVNWSKAGAVNKLAKRKRSDSERDISHILIFAALKLSNDKFCT